MGTSENQPLGAGRLIRAATYTTVFFACGDAKVTVMRGGHR